MRRIHTEIPFSASSSEARAAFHDFELFDFRSFLSLSSSFSILIPIPLLLSYLSSLPPSFSLFHSFFLFFFSLCYFSSSLSLSSFLLIRLKDIMVKNFTLKILFFYKVYVVLVAQNHKYFCTIKVYAKMNWDMFQYMTNRQNIKKFCCTFTTELFSA